MRNALSLQFCRSVVIPTRQDGDKRAVVASPVGGKSNRNHPTGDGCICRLVAIRPRGQDKRIAAIDILLSTIFCTGREPILNLVRGIGTVTKIIMASAGSLQSIMLKKMMGTLQVFHSWDHLIAATRSQPRSQALSSHGP